MGEESPNTPLDVHRESSLAGNTRPPIKRRGMRTETPERESARAPRRIVGASPRGNSGGETAKLLGGCKSKPGRGEHDLLPGKVARLSPAATSDPDR